MTFHRPIRFVYFDLDDTLLDHKHAEYEALKALHAAGNETFGPHSFDTVHEAYSSINPVVWKKYAAGQYTKRQAKVGRFSQLLTCLELSTDGDEELANQYLQAYSGHWKPIEGAIEAFTAIASMLPVGVLTNGFVEIQQAKLRQFPEIADASRTTVISEEIGVLKPDPRLFAESAARAGVLAEHILYVGDSLSSDVQGGIGAGWQVAWYSKEQHDHPDVCSFSDWSELTDLVTGLDSGGAEAAPERA